MSESYLGSPAAGTAQEAGGSNLLRQANSVRAEKSDTKDDIMSMVSDLLKKRWQLEAKVQREAIQKTLEEKNWDVIVTLCRSYPFHPGVLDPVLIAAVEKKHIDAIKQILGVYKYETETLVKVLKFVCIGEEFISHAPEVIAQLPSDLGKPKVLAVYKSMKIYLNLVSEGKQGDLVNAMTAFEKHFEIDEEKRS